MNGWQKLDRAIQYLLSAEECFAADKLDIAKEYKIGDKKEGINVDRMWKQALLWDTLCLLWIVEK